MPGLRHLLILNGDKDPMEALGEVARQQGPIFQLDFIQTSVVFISGQRYAHQICADPRFEKCVHRSLTELRAIVSDGLFTAFNAEPNWGKAHRILVPAFSPAAMRQYFASMLDVADQMFARWERMGPDHAMDVADQMTRATLDTIALGGMGYRLNSFYQEGLPDYAAAIARTLHEAGKRARLPPFLTRLMVGSAQRLETGSQQLYQMTDAIIRKRRAEARQGAPRDLLDHMLDAADPLTGERLDPVNIRNQLVTFLVAGHETTSGMLSFAIYLLLKHPEVLAQVRQAVDGVLQGRPPVYEQMAQLEPVACVLKESLRLYPTAPAFAMISKTDVVLDGTYAIPANTPVFLLLNGLHRDPEAWPEPERFMPSRFAQGAPAPILPDAFLPFGTGVRGCIGRNFAMQEATLILSMMLQRFDFAEAEPYTLKVRESLTVKPEGLRIYARPRAVPEGQRPAAAAAAAQATQAPTQAHQTPLVVAFGSNAGSSELFARRLLDDALSRGYDARLTTLDALVDHLPQAGALLMVTASYNGRPCDNAARFVPWLASAPPQLEGLCFALFGCGDRDWAASYQAVPTAIFKNMLSTGAVPALPRGEADARGDFMGDFERWTTGLWDSLAKALHVPASEAALQDLYTLQIVPAGAPLGEEADDQDGDACELLESRELADMSRPEARSKRHLRLALPPGVSYEAGDYLAIWPVGRAALAQRALQHFGVQASTLVRLDSSRRSVAQLPLDRPVTLGHLLTERVDLAAAATPSDLHKLAASTACPPHAQHLSAMAKDAKLYREIILAERLTLIDLLERYPSCSLGLAAFLECVPVMQPRLYSIASSPKAAPGRCDLTLSPVIAPAEKGAWRGACSGYLADLEPGARVRARVQPSPAGFAPPEDNAAAMLLICAGCGIAPFRAFIQERVARHAASGGETPRGPIALYFGCDHPDIDLLYKDELLAWQAQGVLTLHTAFSQLPENDLRYVQHRVWEQRQRVGEALGAGAHLYLCGAKRLNNPVRAVLMKIYEQCMGGAGDPITWLDALEHQRRFVADTY